MFKIIVSFFLMLFSVTGFALDNDFKEGKHYQQVPHEIIEHEAIETLIKNHEDQVIVLEFFSYGCHWCHEIEPYVSRWLEQSKPEHVDFIRNPVVFQQAWINLSKAFYVAQSLDVFDKLHPALFSAIHANKLTSSQEEDLQAFFAKYGVSQASFSEAFQAFSVEQASKKANQLASAFKITSIPTFIVLGPNGAFLTSTRMAGSERTLFRVIDALVEEEHRASVTHETP